MSRIHYIPDASQSTGLIPSKLTLVSSTKSTPVRNLVARFRLMDGTVGPFSGPWVDDFAGTSASVWLGDTPNRSALGIEIPGPNGLVIDSGVAITADFTIVFTVRHGAALYWTPDLFMGLLSPLQNGFPGGGAPGGDPTESFINGPHPFVSTNTSITGEADDDSYGIQADDPYLLSDTGGGSRVFMKGTEDNLSDPEDKYAPASVFNTLVLRGHAVTAGSTGTMTLMSLSRASVYARSTNLRNYFQDMSAANKRWAFGVWPFALARPAMGDFAAIDFYDDTLDVHAALYAAKSQAIEVQARGTTVFGL